MFILKKGLDIPIANPPEQKIYPAKPITTVALLGKDYLWRKGTLLVAVGDAVTQGQPIVRDKKYPAILGAAPGCGVIEAIHWGSKRTLDSIVIRLDGDEHYPYQHYDDSDIERFSPEQITEILTGCGLWPAIRTRPYNILAQPGSQPHALFVTAIDTNPLAADPAVIIQHAADDFQMGIKVLTKLVTGKVYLCQETHASFPVTLEDNLQVVRFSGPHPAGLVGTHIHFVSPVSNQRQVWHIGYQDVIAVGRFFRSGQRDMQRIIALAGPAVKNPRLIESRIGANTNELVEGEIDCSECRVISGSVLSGHHATGHQTYLGRYHNQITVLSESKQRDFLQWMAPGRNRYSAMRLFISSLLPKKLYHFTTLQNGSARALLPLGMYERVMPLDILATPLLRSIVIKDTDMAQKLGCLELDEEDLALCSFVDPGKFDFGPLLRENLFQIYREG